MVVRRAFAEQAWARSRKAIVQKLGDAIKDPAALDKRSEELFKEIDTDGNGQIDEQELKTAMSNAGVQLSKKELHAMMAEADEDGCAPRPLASRTKPLCFFGASIRLRCSSAAHARDHLIDLGEFKALMKAEVARWKKRTAFCVVL